MKYANCIQKHESHPMAGRAAEQRLLLDAFRLNAIAAFEMDGSGGRASAARVGGIITHFFIKPPSMHSVSYPQTETEGFVNVERSQKE